MRAFLTGSQVYGTPTSKSDIDLVIFVDYVTKQRLIELSDNKKMPCKFGKLNIIFTTNEEDYSVWLLGKKLCLDQKPVDRETSHALHDKARDLFNIQYDHYSGG